METRYPDATWLPLDPEATTQDTIVPVQVILHTIVGSAAGAIRVMQSRDTPGESHLINPFSRNGDRMSQLMPFDRRADCNWQVNRWRTNRPLVMASGRVVPAGSWCGAISIESEDDGTPEDTPWDAGQLDRFARFLAWAHLKLDIPLMRCPDPFSPGVGYHSMPGLNRLASWDPHLTGGPFGSFVDPRGRKVNIWNPWTNTVGKPCPGPARIAQFDALVETARALITTRPPVEQLPTPTPADEDDMADHIITNAEPLPPDVIPGDRAGQPIGQAKFLLLESGRLRHIRTLREWQIRGSKQGIPWTLSDIRESGVVPGS
jgi:hypothetical protein